MHRAGSGIVKPGSAEPLRAIMGHHVWATLGLLDHCRQLSPEQLELTVPGTFGTIHATLEHLVRADAGYQRRITGGARVPPPDELPPLASLRSSRKSLPSTSPSGPARRSPRLGPKETKEPPDLGRRRWPPGTRSAGC